MAAGYLRSLGLAAEGTDSHHIFTLAEEKNIRIGLAKANAQNAGLAVSTVAGGVATIERIAQFQVNVNTDVSVGDLVSSAAITWDITEHNVADLVLGHNTTLRLSNGTNGQVALLRVTQDATGGRTLACLLYTSPSPRDS